MKKTLMNGLENCLSVTATAEELCILQKWWDYTMKDRTYCMKICGPDAQEECLRKKCRDRICPGRNRGLEDTPAPDDILVPV
jgi:hypothetical protein